MRLNYATISSVTGAGWTSFRPDHLLRRAALDAEPLPTSPHMPASVRWHTHTLALDAESLPVSPRIGVPEEPSEAPVRPRRSRRRRPCHVGAATLHLTTHNHKRTG